MMERTIRCTQENLPEALQVVRAWPELLSVIKDAQAHGVFAGMRGVSFTITGNEQTLARGLGSVLDAVRVRHIKDEHHEV